jgi:hypothetical protein
MRIRLKTLQMLLLTVLTVTVLKMLLTLMLLNVLAATFAQGSSHPASLTFIVENMERAQSEISIPNHVTRDYRLGRQGSASVDSYGIAEVDFRPPGKYTVTKRSGSRGCDQAVKYILQHEIDIAMSIKKSRSVAVTRENYVFQYLGETVLDGHSYYLLHLDPKRKQPELIVGQAWVDKQSFLIARIEGNIAKSPSWLVKSVHVRFDFTSPRGMWVQSNLEAVAEIRWLGAQKLTSHVLDYSRLPEASVVAATAQHTSPALMLPPSRRP